MLFDTNTDGCVLVTHDEPIVLHIALPRKYRALISGRDRLELLTNRLRLVIDPNAISVQQADRLELNASIGKECHLVSRLVGLNTIAQGQRLLVHVLNFDVTVTYTSLVQSNLFREQKAVNLNPHAYLVAIVATTVKRVEVFLLRLHQGVVGLLLVVTRLLEELFLRSESLLALYLHVTW